MIAILGEYDALPGLSQEAGIAEPRPVEANGVGHGCGHNLLGSAAMLAATAVKDYLAENGIEGPRPLLRLPGRGGRRRQGLHGARRRLRGRGHRHLLAPGLLLRRERAGIARQHPHRLHLHRPLLACRGGARISGAARSTRSS